MHYPIFWTQESELWTPLTNTIQVLSHFSLFSSPAANGSVRSPCDYRLESTMGHSCDLPYTFKNKLSLTKDLDQFEIAVNQTRISGNLDGPEGGLEAMMQVCACG